MKENQFFLSIIFPFFSISNYHNNKPHVVKLNKCLLLHLFLILIFFPTIHLFSQTDSTDIYELDLSQLSTIKFTPAGSGISIEDEIENGYYKILVIDNGSGFTKDLLEKKFELLQVGELLSHSEGTGLSLFAAKSIMDMHGYKMTIQNAPEGGALIELIFPQRN